MSNLSGSAGFRGLNSVHLLESGKNTEPPMVNLAWWFPNGLIFLLANPQVTKMKEQHEQLANGRLLEA